MSFRSADWRREIYTQAIPTVKVNRPITIVTPEILFMCDLKGHPEPVEGRAEGPLPAWFDWLTMTLASKFSSHLQSPMILKLDMTI